MLPVSICSTHTTAIYAARNSNSLSFSFLGPASMVLQMGQVPHSNYGTCRYLWSQSLSTLIQEVQSLWRLFGFILSHRREGTKTYSSLLPLYLVWCKTGAIEKQNHLFWIWIPFFNTIMFLTIILFFWSCRM